MHGPHHTRDETIDAVALLDQRDERGYSALVVGCSVEVSEYELLERFDLVLEIHQVRNRLISCYMDLNQPASLLIRLE